MHQATLFVRLHERVKKVPVALNPGMKMRGADEIFHLRDRRDHFSDQRISQFPKLPAIQVVTTACPAELHSLELPNLKRRPGQNHHTVIETAQQRGPRHSKPARIDLVDLGIREPLSL